MTKRKDGKPRSMPSGAVPMTQSGHCMFPSKGSHDFCSLASCQCSCHQTADHSSD